MLRKAICSLAVFSFLTGSLVSQAEEKSESFSVTGENEVTVTSEANGTAEEFRVENLDEKLKEGKLGSNESEIIAGIRAEGKLLATQNLNPDALAKGQSEEQHLFRRRHGNFYGGYGYGYGYRPYYGGLYNNYNNFGYRPYYGGVNINVGIYGGGYNRFCYDPFYYPNYSPVVVPYQQSYYQQSSSFYSSGYGYGYGF